MALHDLGRTTDTPSMGMGSAFARLRFAVLWLVVACATAGSFAVFYAEPGRLEEGVAGVMEGEPVTMGMAYVYAAMVGLPLLLAATALFLAGRAGAIANLVVAVPIGAFGLYASVAELTQGALHPHVALGTVAAVIAWLIAGLSIAELRHRSHRDAAPAAGAAARGAA